MSDKIQVEITHKGKTHLIICEYAGLPGADRNARLILRFKADIVVLPRGAKITAAYAAGNAKQDHPLDVEEMFKE